MACFVTLALAPFIAGSGCASQRYKARYQAEVDSMRAEYFELEDRYYETLGELEATQSRLDRELRASGRATRGVEDSSDDVDSGASDTRDLPMPVREDDDDDDDAEETRSGDQGRWMSPTQRSQITQVYPRLGNAQPNSTGSTIPPHPMRRQYGDPSETTAERERRLARRNDSREMEEPPYDPSLDDERDYDSLTEINEPRLVAPQGGEPAATYDLDESDWNEAPTETPAAIVDWEVTEITIDPRQTRGFDRDGVIGDEGIVLVVHPRNQMGQSLPVFAPVLVSIIDPAEVDEAQRVGLWEFSAEELAYRQPPAAINGQGMAIRLTWPNGKPNHERLTVFVRYEADSGRTLEAKREVTINLGTDDQSAWSIRSTPLRSAQQPPSRPRPSSDTTVPSPRGATPARQVSETTAPRTSRPTWSPLR
ncbi:MAG: hypothetical protein R3B96_03090 [Pirellulaceae bacterium]